SSDLDVLRPRSASGRSVVDGLVRLRDTLNMTANRVARFGADARPGTARAPVYWPAYTQPVSARQLAHQIDVTVRRLVRVLDEVEPDDWDGARRIAGDAVVTLGELVDDTVHHAAHDLLALLGATADSGAPPAGPAAGFPIGEPR